MKFSRAGPLDEAGVRRFVEWCLESYQTHGYGQWALICRDTGRLIGFAGLSQTTVEQSEEVELAYRLLPDRWGQGMAAEAASAILNLGFSRWRIESIVGIVADRHPASIRVLEKIGFDSYVAKRHHGWDVRLYRLDSNHWAETVPR